jgi:hypothetical protein
MEAALVKKIPLWLRSILCGPFFFVFTSFLIFIMAGFDTIGIVFLFLSGLFCGAVIAFITLGKNVTETILARIAGVVSFVIFQWILYNSSTIPHRILMYIYRNDSYVLDTGRLSVNHTVGVGFGMLIFWRLAFISFIISVAGIFVYNLIKKHRLKYKEIAE